MDKVKWLKGFIILDVMGEDNKVYARAIDDYCDMWKSIFIFKTREEAEKFRQTIVKGREDPYWERRQIIEVKYYNSESLKVGYDRLKKGFKALVQNKELLEQKNITQEKVHVKQVVKEGLNIDDLGKGSHLIKRGDKHLGIITLYE